MAALTRAAGGSCYHRAMTQRLALVLIGGGLVLIALFHNRIYNTFAGPFEIEASDVVKLTEVPFGRYVRLVENGKPVAYSQLVRTGASEVEYRGGGMSKTVASYKLLVAGGRRMVVRFEDGFPADQVEGMLTESDSMQREIVDQKVYLDGSKSRYKAWTLAIVALALGAIGVGLDQLRRMRRRPAQRPLRLFT